MRYQHPRDGTDIAFLLLYPTGNDIAAKMRRLAEGCGLMGALSGEMPCIDRQTTHATVDGEPVVRIIPGARFLHRAVTAEWAAIARARGEIVYAIGERALRYDYRRPLRAIDKYVADGHGLYAGLLSVDTIE